MASTSACSGWWLVDDDAWLDDNDAARRLVAQATVDPVHTKRDAAVGAATTTAVGVADTSAVGRVATDAISNAAEGAAASETEIDQA